MSDLATILCSTAAGLDAFIGMSYLMDYANVKAAALQKYLANSTELTDEVIKLAHKTANQLASGDYLMGLGFLIAAGFLTGLALINVAYEKK